MKSFIKTVGIGVILLSCTAFGFINFYALEYPSYFPIPEYDLKSKPLTKNKIALGRILFYDPILSNDGTISCASCHSPYNAFAHTDHDLSHGIFDQIGTRNAPPLFNLAWQNTFMWDGAINHLEVQSLAPISSSLEMGSDIASVVNKLNRHKQYPELFYKAFKDSIITGKNVLLAIAQFELTLVSSGSKYDEVKKGAASFSEQEEKGYNLFLKHCNSCHQEPLFNSNKFENNGLVVDTTLNDYGRWTITKVPEDSLMFKIPSLRNLSFTYPYMHDGRFKKLNEVLNHYSNGRLLSKTLAPVLQGGISLTSIEKTDLISFLLTLNDKEFVFNKKHQNPISEQSIKKIVLKSNY